MTYTQERILAALLPASAFLLCFGMAAYAQPPLTLPIDRTEQVDGIATACTGIGDREERESRWHNFPVKLETVGGYGQWLGDQVVSVHGTGETVRVHCDAPWLLMGLKPGRYEATVRVPDAAPRQVSFTVPRRGQRDVIVRFPRLTNGEESAAKA